MELLHDSIYVLTSCQDQDNDDIISCAKRKLAIQKLSESHPERNLKLLQQQTSINKMKKERLKQYMRKHGIDPDISKEISLFEDFHDSTNRDESNLEEINASGENTIISNTMMLSIAEKGDDDDEDITTMKLLLETSRGLTEALKTTGNNRVRSYNKNISWIEIRG